jgi:citrate lyase beta subunit
MSELIASARSLLFVPGNRPERFAKAAASGADVVCIDLEDAVPPAERAAARRAVVEHLAGAAPGHRFGVRVSRLASADGLRDLLALADANARPAFVMLAKTENAAQAEMLAAQLPGLPLIALIESARGLHAAAEIARAHPAVAALMLGGVDLCAELGCPFGWDALAHARGTLVLAAAAAGVGLIDVPYLDVAHPDGAREEAARVAALGFTGKSCIHPSQVAAVHAGFAPAAADVEAARRVLAAAGSAGTDAAAVLVDGKLVDRPVIAAAQRLLSRLR